MLTVTFLLPKLIISLGIDTGASVTLLSESAYSTFKLKFPDLPFELQKSNVTLSSVQGSTLHVTGTVTLLVSLAPASKIFNIQFYVTPQSALPSDGLFSDQRFQSAIDVNFPLLSSAASTFVTIQRHVTSASPAPLPGTSEEKRSSSELWTVSAVVIGDQHIGPSCAARLSVRLKNAPVGSLVISAPDSMHVHRYHSSPHSLRSALITSVTPSSLTKQVLQ